MQTIYGKKIQIKNNLGKDEIISEINKKLGYDKDKIFIYKNIFGVFNVKSDNLNEINKLKRYDEKLNHDNSSSCNDNIYFISNNIKQENNDNLNINEYSKYGVPDYVYNFYVREEKQDFFLDYESIRIVPSINFNIPEELSKDRNLSAQLFKHFLCENHQPKELQQINLDNYIEYFLSGDHVSFKEEDKVIINNNLEKIIESICKEI